MLKRSSLKCKFLRLLSAWVKIRKIPRVNFETISQFLCKCFIIFGVKTHNFSVYFQFIHFLLWEKGSSQIFNFDTLKCSGQNLLSSSCLYFTQKKPIKVEILRISRSRVKISQFLVIFETITRVFFEFCITLHCHEINPLYLFSCNFIYLFNVQIWWNFA